MSGSGLRLSSYWVPVRLWVGHLVLLTRLEPTPVKGEEAFSLPLASGFEAVVTYGLLWVSLQCLSLSQLGRRGETQPSRTLTVSCFALRVIAIVWFLCMFHSFKNSFLFLKRSILGKRSWRWGEWKIMGENCFSTVLCLLGARRETLCLCFVLFFCFCLESYSNGIYNITWGDKLQSYRARFQFLFFCNIFFIKL